MPPETESLRDTLESAFDEHSAPDTTDTAQSVSPAPEAPASDAKPASEDRGDGRRMDGKFARKVAAQPDVGAPAGDAAGKPAADASVAPADAGKLVEAEKPDPFAKAPQSWKPGAREAWASVPPDVRAEVYRREKEAARVVQESHQARGVTEYVQQLHQRYAPALQAEGVDVLTAAGNLMDLSSRLRFGQPHEKAAIAAQIIRGYGVDVEALANALDGQQQPQQRQQPMMDPRVDQLLEELNSVKQQRAEAVQQKAVGEVEAFGEGKEFFTDVREDMADILEVAARRKIDLSLEQAYERACKMQPDIAKVLEAREAAKRAGTGRQSTQQARLAASSVRGTPGTVSTSQPDNLRGAIEAAIEQVGGR
jgi:hypothetical protein